MKVLERLGYEFKRSKGGHDIYDRQGARRPIPVPQHPGDLPTHVARSIWRSAGISPEEAEELLR